mmetsp:Transcript_20700/g.79363  ORF Transcript_20700/g.79363 Transcript_20700/m.79363 type:complete len:229 (-) Transcript_20700:84-770(-)
MCRMRAAVYGLVMRRLWVREGAAPKPMPLDVARNAASREGQERAGDLVPHVLLQRRSGTGWADGMLTLPSGHVELHEHIKEALQRELWEEAAVDCKAKDLVFMLVNHRRSSAKREYIDFFFGLEDWTGEPSIQEPDKCSELLFHPVTYEDVDLDSVVPEIPNISHPAEEIKPKQLVPGIVHAKGQSDKRLALPDDVIPHVRDALEICIPRMLGDSPNTAKLIEYYPRE